MLNIDKIKNIFGAFFILILIFFAYSAKAYEKNSKTQIISPNVENILIKWNSDSGMARLNRSKYKNDFYQLVNFYQPQINPLYCSVASSVIVLNALRNGEIASQKELEIKRQNASGAVVAEFKSYSQLTFLNKETDKIKLHEIIEYKKPKEIKNGKEIFDAGLALKDLADILTKVYKLKISLVYAKKDDTKSINNFRAELKKYLNDDKNFIIANFDGAMLGARVGGHFSPIVAYDEESDSLLVLDVALHKETWYFAPLTKFYEAMHSKDGDDYRGYLVVAK